MEIKAHPSIPREFLGFSWKQFKKAVYKINGKIK